MNIPIKRLTLFVFLIPSAYAAEYACHAEAQSFCEGNESQISCQAVERRKPGYIRSIDINFDKPSLKTTTWVGGTYDVIEKEVLQVQQDGRNRVITFKSNPQSISHLSMSNDQFKLLHDVTLSSAVSYYLVIGSCEEKCGTCS